MSRRTFVALAICLGFGAALVARPVGIDPTQSRILSDDQFWSLRSRFVLYEPDPKVETVPLEEARLAALELAQRLTIPTETRVERGSIFRGSVPSGTPGSAERNVVAVVLENIQRPGPNLGTDRRDYIAFVDGVTGEAMFMTPLAH